VKTSLRKSLSQIYVSYSDDDYSNNLSGKDFILKSTKTTNKICINLVGNLNQRNKQSNSYADILHLVEKHDQLSMVQIDEPQIYEGLVKSKNSNPEAKWELEFSVGDKGTFIFEASPSIENDSVSIALSQL